MIKSFFGFLLDMFKSRKLILELTKKDFKARYLGSYLGILWAFIQPLVTIFIMWFVFQIGFKSAPIQDLPFILWLLPGMIPWTFISDSIINGTNSVVDNNYLVKKVVFRVSVLPLIKILSAFFIHVFFIGVIFIAFFISGYTPDIFNIEVIYYVFASLVLVLGISWITSSLVVFIKDLGQVVAVVLQILFWATPIFWSYKMIPVNYHFLFRINPVYYIIEGYRDAFIYKLGFWQHPGLMIFFWTQTAVIFIIGALLFKKLRPHFADVL